MASNVTALAPRDQTDWALMEKVVVQGDLAQLSPKERMQYYRYVCESMGLNPATKPFNYISLWSAEKKAKVLTLYATKDAADQLRRNNGVSLATPDVHNDGETFEVWITASTPDGRTDTELGAVAIKGLTGNDLANAKMKAVTKAKRRVTLSICGLGFLDETEIETIKGARPVLVDEDGVIHDEEPEPQRITARSMLADSGTPASPPQPPPARISSTRGGANTGKGFTTAALVKKLNETYPDTFSLPAGATFGQVLRAVEEAYGEEVPAERSEEDGKPVRFPSTVWEFVKEQESQLPAEQ